jgi:hypothetical protein
LRAAGAPPARRDHGGADLADKLDTITELLLVYKLL